MMRHCNTLVLLIPIIAFSLKTGLTHQHYRFKHGRGYWFCFTITEINFLLVGVFLDSVQSLSD